MTLGELIDALEGGGPLRRDMTIICNGRHINGVGDSERAGFVEIDLGPALPDEHLIIEQREELSGI